MSEIQTNSPEGHDRAYRTWRFPNQDDFGWRHATAENRKVYTATRYWHAGLRWRDFCPNPVPNDPQELSVRIFQNVESLAEKQTRNQK